MLKEIPCNTFPREVKNKLPNCYAVYWQETVKGILWLDNTNLKSTNGNQPTGPHGDSSQSYSSIGSHGPKLQVLLFSGLSASGHRLSSTIVSVLFVWHDIRLCW